MVENPLTNEGNVAAAPTHEKVLFTLLLVVRAYPTAVPEQMAVAVTFAPVGVGLTVTTAEPVNEVPTQVLASLTAVTVYVPAVASVIMKGLAVIPVTVVGVVPSV